MPFKTKKRQKFAQAERRRQVAELYLSGLTQEQVAARLHTTQKTVSKDVAAVEEMWREDCVAANDRRKGQVLAGLEMLRACAWDAFRRTQGKQTRTVTEGRPAAPGSPPKTSKVLITSEESSGDPRFLQTVLSTYQEEAKLLGLNAPAKLAHTMPDGSPVPTGPLQMIHTIEATPEEIADAVAELAVEDSGPATAPDPDPAPDATPSV
jgi:hypothetical protein